LCANLCSSGCEFPLSPQRFAGHCVIGHRAHLGVARTNALESRTTQGADADAGRVRALAAYRGFLTLWKDADPDVPMLKEAKAEYAKLQ
jgi:eukaryotic-like serine/threonine-protein kinase